MRALASLLALLVLAAPASATKPKKKHPKPKPKVKVAAPTTTTTPGVDPKQLLLASQLTDAAAAVAGGMAGANVSYTYGFYQVTIQLNGTAISDCKIVYQTSYPRSHDINEGADGTLCQEALAAQSAAVHNVSGATMTTNVFEASLQSALVKAHLAALGSVLAGTVLMRRATYLSVALAAALAAAPVGLAKKPKPKAHHKAKAKAAAPESIPLTAAQLAALQVQANQQKLILAKLQAQQAAAVPGGIAGANISYNYGTYQVTVQISGGKLTDCSITYNAEPPRSHDINDQADPVLCQEALQAQAAVVHNVSGATMTANVFMASLQSALVAAGMMQCCAVLPGGY